MGALVAGVANREARAVYESRTSRLREASGVEPADEQELARALCEARRLGVWRGGRLTSFAAWVEEVVGIASGRAEELAAGGAAALGVSLERLPEPLVALWFRAEAALLRACPDGRVEIVGEGESASLRLALPAQRPRLAAAGLEEIGQAAEAFLRVLLEARPPR